ncbi:hypothetical protein [Thermobifida alba]|uniref:hypothetical protein n=1 Tax=Thermobifida alba TaxID=53522 RepID=UPI0020BE343B|nr:hypothetical protein [Thermobifida alba]
MPRGEWGAPAARLARRGHEGVAAARSAAARDDLPVAGRGGLDGTDPESVRRAAHRVGAVDVLVDNAGRGMRPPSSRPSTRTCAPRGRPPSRARSA